ncbi:putative interleukin-17 receptor E-like [Spea bombifrons]|uniref:putative interleukin-17 receptor E-like n=1 Tax=Spea bombifrons TaxID=233779 RepID=UPI002349288C|nr:putative interleukin-17 receptor E-like [Spea bombifrons]
MEFLNGKCCFVHKKTATPHFLIIFIYGVSICHSIQRIKECGLTCSRGVHCRSRETSGFFCEDPPDSLLPTVLENMKISTAMKCQKMNQCSLYLDVKGTIALDENIKGVEICSLTLSTQQNQCTSVKFSRIKTGTKKVDVQFNCFEVSTGQHVYVSMKTIPYFCNIELEEEYHVEDCYHSVVGNSIPSCSAGKLNYMVDEEKKTITVHVSDNLEEYDYNVRLCLKHYSCQDISGAHALIKMGNSSKSVTFPYSEILPCLCIEGWSAFTDARRIRLCPFKNETSTLWDSITYNPMIKVLAWEPSCAVQVTVNLCWLTNQDDKCVKIPKSERTTVVDQVSYKDVDTHPRLCMEFTTEMGSWVRCPFGFGQFPGWDMEAVVTDEQIEIRITSHTMAKFSVVVCNKIKFAMCESLQTFTLVHGGTSGFVSHSVSRELCSYNICIQVLRTDVNYSFPVQICNISCNQPFTPFHKNILPVLAVAAGFLIMVTMITIIGYAVLKVYYRMKPKQEITLKTKVKHLSSEIASSLEQRYPFYLPKMMN